MHMRIKHFFEVKLSAARGVVWDALKAFIRGLCIKEISTIKIRSKWASDVARKVDKAEELYLRNPTPEHERQWTDAQKLYRTLTTS